jgi:hypothetical protein
MTNMNTQRELTVDKLVQMNRAAIEGTKPIKEDDPMLRLVPQMIEALQWTENAAEKARDVLDQVEEA